MSSLKKATSLFSLKGKKKEANESAENLIPEVPDLPASTASAHAGPSGKGSSFLRKARSFVGQDKTPMAAPPVPTDQLPKNLRIYADMVPGAGSRDRATKTPPPSPTAGTHDGRTGSIAIEERHQKRPLPARLTSRLAKVERQRKDAELADALALNKTREPEQRVAKVPPNYTHNPMAQGTWKEPGMNPSSQSSVKMQTKRFPESKKAAAVIGPESTNLQGFLKDAQGRADKKGREAMPEGNRGRKKYEKIANEKGKGGPSV